MIKNIVFRADAGPVIGLGHVMRCLALAEAMIDAGATCHLAIADPAEALIERLAKAGIVVHALAGLDDTAGQTAILAQAIGAQGIVVDGYHFSDVWRQSLRAAGMPILTFADGPIIPGYADLWIDASAAPSTNSCELFGRDFILLRADIIAAAELSPLPMAERHSILVTFGGSDPAGLTLPVSIALRKALPDTALEIVIGGAVPNGAEVAHAVAALGPKARAHLAPDHMGPLMRNAGLAVTAAGSTLGELAAVGVAVVLVVVADNQVSAAQACKDTGWGSCIDFRTDSRAALSIAEAAADLWHDQRGRENRAALARHLVDTQGAKRVVDRFFRYLDGGDKV